jgi:hypothetical protein
MRWLIAFILSILLIAGATYLHSTLTQYRQEVINAQRYWPSTNGKIRDTRVDIADGVLLTIDFDYRVDGMNLRGMQTVDADPATYYRGERIKVYYDPKNFRDAVIRPFSDDRWWQLLVFILPVFSFLTMSTILWSWAVGHILGWVVGVGVCMLIVAGLYAVSLMSGIPFTILIIVSIWILPVIIGPVIHAVRTAFGAKATPAINKMHRKEA